ncbi:MAG: acyl-CoA dehydrogenase [Rhizomicrobium sp.]
MMAEALRVMLADKCSGADLRRLLASGASHDSTRMRILTDMGLSGACVPENLGGLGLSEADFVLLAETAGRALLPEPLVEAAGVALPLLADVAHSQQARDALASAISGQILVVFGHPENPFLCDADTAQALLLVREGTLYLVSRDAVKLTPVASADPFRRLSVATWEPSIEIPLVSGASAAALLDLALDRGALFAAAQGLGIAEACIAMAAAHAQQRFQFGAPIGANQAVKHLLANAQVKLEFARPVTYVAAAGIGAQTVRSRARVSHAKLAALEAAEFAARAAIQVHGAMGYSWDIDVHFHLKRALALAGAWGSARFHRARVACLLCEGALGPEYTFTTTEEIAHA